MDPRTRRSPARLLAPLALIAVIVAFLMVVNSSGGGGGSSSSATDTGGSTATSKSTATKTSTSTTKAKTKTGSSASKVYVVQVGDTFGGIADKTGVPIDRLQELNPAVDAHAMTVGQKIKLK